MKKIIILLAMFLVTASMFSCVEQTEAITTTEVITTTEKITIDDINGVPELYGLTWGMSISEVSELLGDKMDIKERTDYETKEKHIEIAGFDWEEYPSLVRCFFGANDTYLDNVTFIFTDDDVSFEELKEQYISEFGTPEVLEDYFIWEGKSTRIWMLHDGDYIVLEYVCRRDINDVFSPSENGNAADPFGFSTDNKLFREHIEKLTVGLTEDIDYFVGEHSGFTYYHFFPEFSYFGSSTGDISIELTPETDNIDTVTYAIHLDSKDSEKMFGTATEVWDTLKELYGNSSGGMIVSDTEFDYDCTYDEIYNKLVSKEKGAYYMGWENDGVDIFVGFNTASSETEANIMVSYSLLEEK